MKTIPLTRGLFSTVDDEDYIGLAKVKWHAHFSPHHATFYARRSVRLSPRKRVTALMHRSILMLPLSLQVDHWDRNGLNNQKYNLRGSNSSQNQANRGLDRDEKTSKYKGVHWDSRDKAWRAQIHVRGKKRGLGYYAEERQAAMAYNLAAVEAFGEFARINVLGE